MLNETEIRNVFSSELASFWGHVYYAEGSICVQHKLFPQDIKSFTWYRYITLPKKERKLAE